MFDGRNLSGMGAAARKLKKWSSEPDVNKLLAGSNTLLR